MTTTDTPLYPVTYSGWPGCTLCFQPGDLQHAIDPRDPDGPLLHACLACHRALSDGRPITLPDTDTLAETWERLARMHHNGEISDEVIDGALASLTPPGLPPQAGWQRFEQLTEALLRVQHIRSDDFDPADGDRDYLEGEAVTDAEHAVATLTGGRS